MAYLDDYTDEERAKLEEQGGSAPAANGAAGGGGASAPAPSSGFANLSAYFNANQDAAKAQGAGLYSDLENRAKDAIDKEDAGAAMSTLGEIDAAATPGGIASAAGNDNGAGYTSGMAQLDGYLSTRGGGGDFAGLREMYGERLGNVRSGYTAPVAPTAPGLTSLSDWMDGVEDNDAKAAGEIVEGAGSGALAGNQVAGPVGAVAGGLIGGGAAALGSDLGFAGDIEGFVRARQDANADWEQSLRDYVSQLNAYNEYRRSIGKDDVVAPSEVRGPRGELVDWAQYGYAG